MTEPADDLVFAEARNLARQFGVDVATSSLTIEQAGERWADAATTWLALWGEAKANLLAAEARYGARNAHTLDQ